jgi:hypothetical protein
MDENKLGLCVSNFELWALYFELCALIGLGVAYKSMVLVHATATSDTTDFRDRVKPQPLILPSFSLGLRDTRSEAVNRFTGLS